MRLEGCPGAQFDGVFRADATQPRANGKTHYSSGDGAHLYFHSGRGMWFINDCCTPDAGERYASIRGEGDEDAPPVGTNTWQWWDGAKWGTAQLSLAEHTAGAARLPVARDAAALPQHRPSCELDISPSGQQVWCAVALTRFCSVSTKAPCPLQWSSSFHHSATVGAFNVAKVGTVLCGMSLRTFCDANQPICDQILSADLPLCGTPLRRHFRARCRPRVPSSLDHCG